MDKIKNIFTEEVEEEVKTIKKEVIQVPIAAPVKEEEKEIVTESEALKEKDEKFVFPVFFDDEDFSKIEPKKTTEVKTNDYGSKIEKEEIKKVFKPTPIISPVYGVLDKNYHKEDITTKKHENTYVPKKGITVDDIRNKAFGTLEDDLEDTLYGKNSIFFNDEVEEEQPDLFDELEEKETNSVDDFLNKEFESKKVEQEDLAKNIEEANDEPLTRTRKYRIKEELAELEASQTEENESNKSMELDDIEPDENIVNEILENEFSDEDKNDDLFDLVDSMYDEKEDE